MTDQTAGNMQKELDRTSAEFKEYAKFSDNKAVATDYATKDLHVLEIKDETIQTKRYEE